MKATTTQCHQPWNKEKLVGQKAPFGSEIFWIPESGSRSRKEPRISFYSTRPSTASFGPVI